VKAFYISPYLLDLVHILMDKASPDRLEHEGTVLDILLKPRSLYILRCILPRYDQFLFCTNKTLHAPASPHNLSSHTSEGGCTVTISPMPFFPKSTHTLRVSCRAGLKNGYREGRRALRGGGASLSENLLFFLQHVCPMQEIASNVGVASPLSSAMKSRIAVPPRMELSVEPYRKNYWAKNNQTKYL